jgi:hypothetical protein
MAAEHNVVAMACPAAAQDCQGKGAYLYATGTNACVQGLQFTIQDMQLKVAISVPELSEKLLIALLEKVFAGPLHLSGCKLADESNPTLVLLGRLIVLLSNEILSHSDGVREAVSPVRVLYLA